MKHKLNLLAAAAAAVCTLGLSVMTASAEGSVQDIYDAMRTIGLPETMVQEAANQYASHPELHDENGITYNNQYHSYAEWADMIITMEDTIWNKIAERYGVPASKIREYINSQPEVTQASSQTAQTTSASGESGSKTTTTTTVTERKSDMNFIRMSAEEKQAYIMAMSEDERAKFLANLTTAERNSILKQMAVDDQADIMKEFVDIGKEMGMNISVDKIDGSSINYSVRDPDGKLIDSAGLGTTVDDTGWDLTLPVIGSLTAVLLSVGGIVWLAVRSRKEQDNG